MAYCAVAFRFYVGVGDGRRGVVESTWKFVVGISRSSLKRSIPIVTDMSVYNGVLTACISSSTGR